MKRAMYVGDAGLQLQLSSTCMQLVQHVQQGRRKEIHSEEEGLGGGGGGGGRIHISPQHTQ